MSQGARVLQVNVSRGGVPKLPVDRAWVGRFGVEGDEHHDLTEHGGPHRAVCLFGIEAIERLQSEGHPVEPGSVGENLTTLGVEWSTLAVGTRARVGERLLLEIADSTTPCATQKHNFSDGRFSRISIDLHPADSRMYARVLEEGPAAPGDAIEILPPAVNSRAQDERVLARLDRAAAKSNLAAWRALQAAGFDIRIVDNGEIAMTAAPAIPGPAFNQATGFARLPNLLATATDFFEHHATTGWVVAEDPPWADAPADLELAVYAGRPEDLRVAGGPPTGVTLRCADEPDGALVEQVMRAAGASDPPAVWSAVMAGLAGHPHATVVLAEEAGRPVAAAVLYLHHRTAWLRGASVVPQARGRGLQRALIAERARLAIERGGELLGAAAEPGSRSARNLEQAGLRRVGVRRQYRYQPAALAATG